MIEVGNLVEFLDYPGHYWNLVELHDSINFSAAECEYMGALFPSTKPLYEFQVTLVLPLERMRRLDPLTLLARQANGNE
jgi:hypothetical protein